MFNLAGIIERQPSSLDFARGRSAAQIRFYPPKVPVGGESVVESVYDFFGNLLSTAASVGTRPLSPSFKSAGAGPGVSGADW